MPSISVLISIKEIQEYIEVGRLNPNKLNKKQKEIVKGVMDMMMKVFFKDGLKNDSMTLNEYFEKFKERNIEP